MTLTQLIGKLLCRLKRHKWVRMGWKEAYPASAGFKCARCNLCRLSW